VIIGNIHTFINTVVPSRLIVIVKLNKGFDFCIPYKLSLIPEETFPNLILYF